jgi:hypothetical protein
MSNENYDSELILARAIIGYLGEKSKSNWWSSEFFSTTSDPFLSPVFAKTKNLARYSGVVEAGRRVHDESIGVGQRVFHLFRVPAPLEQRLHESVASGDLDEVIAAATSSKDAAVAKLAELADGSAQTAEGPIAISDSADFVNGDWLSVAAQCYLKAFEANKQCFPYIKANA